MEEVAVPRGASAHAPLTGPTRLWGTLAVSVATFMNVLDMSITNVSLPAIAGDLGVSPNQGTWVITSFAVANAIGLPLTGWLSRRFGEVRLYVTSILLFVLASWMCALAPDMSTLIAFRALQGFVAAPLIPLSQTLLLASYPPALAGLAMSTWSMTALLGPLLGPVLGGWITDNASWPWLFYINIPVGLAAAAAVWVIYGPRESEVRRVPIDRMGLVLLVLWIGALQLMLDLGKEHDWFASGFVVALAAVAALGLVVFLIWELTTTHPVVDLTLFAERNFWAGTLALSVGFGLYFGNLVLLPLWLQQFMGYTATDAGLVLAPVGLSAILLSPLVGRRLATADPRRFVTFAFILYAGVLWLRSQFTTGADFFTLALPALLQGAAMPFFFVPLSAMLLAGLPGERMAAAAGLSNFLRISAGAFGTSLATTLWESRAALHHAQITESVHAGSAGTRAALDTLSAAGLTREQSLAEINRLVNQQAFTLAANDLFLASAVLFLLLIPLVWLSRPRRHA